MSKKFTKSFYDWCVENNHEDWLELWDYELNDCSPKEVGYGSDKKYFFKCPREVHKSEEKFLHNLTNNKKYQLRCNWCNSFGQYLIDTYGEDALEKYWDYEKNKINPFEISKGSHNKIWIFCQKKSHHGSYNTQCNIFYSGYRCSYCVGKKVHPKDSFGQYLIDTYGENALEKYWDYNKNKVNPFNLPKCGTKTVWIKCQEKEHHGSYKIECSKFYNGKRCSYCGTLKTHPKDSLGQKLIDDCGEDAIEIYWSKKNTVNPFEVAPYSNKKYWFICQNDKTHKDYEMKPNDFTRGRRCPKCKESHGEREIRKYLNIHSIDFIPQKEFPDLVGISEWKPLSYDFYLPEQNLLIEYQGNYHDGTVSNQTEEDYLKQHEHDRRKREYAQQHRIRLLEIWYWDFDNIETILNENIK